MLPSKVCYFWCICVSILFTGRSGKQGCALRKIPQGLGGRGVTLVNFCWVCAAGLPEPFPIIVYSGAKNGPHLSHFWENVIFVIPT